VTTFVSNPISRFDAILCVLETSDIAKRAAYPFGISVKVDCSPSDRKTPYFSTIFNRDDLGAIELVAYQNSIAEAHASFSPDLFLQRVLSGFQEELIHCVQILSTRLLFAKSDSSYQRFFVNAGDFYRQIKQVIFAELSQNSSGRQLLLSSGRLYYAKPSISSPDDLMKHDIQLHKSPGYSVVETARQLIQARMQVPLSEVTNAPAWDSLGFFGEDSITHLRDLSSLVQYHAPSPEKVSPRLAKFIADTESIFQDSPNGLF